MNTWVEGSLPSEIKTMLDQLGASLCHPGDTARAKAAYQDFFALWKDADPDSPILKEAKAEYAKLK